MVMDEYYEQVLYEDHKSKIKFIKFVQAVLLIIAATCLFARVFIGVIIPIILLTLTLIYSNKRLAEYEYHLCENELRIYKIVCESRRKLIDKLDLNNIKRASKVSEYLKSDGAMDCYVGDSDNYTMLKLTVMRRGEYKDYVIAVDDRMLKNFKRINPSTFLFF